MSRWLFGVLLVAVTALAQVGGPYPYPGSDPYPTRIPGSPDGTGPPFPLPGTKRSPAPASSADPLASFPGGLKVLGVNTILISTADGREIEFRRTRKTRFLKAGKEVGASEFATGDRVTIEATKDRRSKLEAVIVHHEGKAPDPLEDTPPVDPDTTAPSSTVMASPRAKLDPDDPGPPVLARGRVARRPSAPSVPASDSGSTPRPDASPEESTGVLLAGENSADPLIVRARHVARQFTDTLPNYVCTQIVTRYESTTRPVDWRARDVITLELTYNEGKESYSGMRINGKKVSKDITQMDGTWSTGEFATTLLDIFSTPTQAHFTPRGSSLINGARAQRYDFTVEQPHSHWMINTESQSMRPAYQGTLWISPENGRVLRIEKQARNLPGSFPLDAIEMAVDYDNVRLAGASFLLPSRAEVLSCERGTVNCVRNTIDFRNYRKFESESVVTYEAGDASR
jgi:hypothetical protein